MKKLLILSSFLLLSIAGNSQAIVTLMTGSGDTIVDAGSQTVQYAPTISYENLSFQVVVTKISGTVGGNAYLQWSNDNVNYANLDTLALSNVTTNTAIFPKLYSPAYYYRISATGTGTMSAKLFGYMLTNGGKGSRSAPLLMKSSFNLSSDTCVNSATTYVGLDVNNWYQTVSIQAVVTKISGTVGGTVTVQGSDDNVNFVTVNSGFITSTTHTATNVAVSSKMFVITGSPYRYYRLSYTGTGTMSATLKGYLVASK